MIDQPVGEETPVTASTWEQPDGQAALGTNFQDAVDARDDQCPICLQNFVPGEIV